MTLNSKIHGLGKTALYGRNYRELRRLKKVEAERDRLRALLPRDKGAIDKVDLQKQKKALKHLANLQIVWVLKNYRVDCVLDVGANIGQYASSLRKLGYEGHIVSFEPVPQFAAELLHRSSEDLKWHVIPAALATYDGQIEMRVQKDFTSALTQASAFGIQNFATLRTHEQDELSVVPVHRLDSILGDILEFIGGEETVSRIYLKMDTQGFDLEAFGGVGKYMDQIVALQSELAAIKIYEGMPGMSEAMTEFQNAGFAFAGLFPVTTRPDGRVVEFDGVMVQADKFIGPK